MVENIEGKQRDLEWVQLHKDMSKVVPIETGKDKILRKLLENPFVPIGCLATVGALSYGLWNFHKGNSQMSQYMMRARVAAQGFTVFVLLVGVGISATKKN